MNKPYFVMLYSQSGQTATPLVQDNEEVMFFMSYEQAKTAAMNNIMGSAFGWEVFELGDGSCE